MRKELSARRPVGNLGDPLIKKRHTSFDAHRHTRLVDFHHIIVGKLVPRFEQPDRCETIAVHLLRARGA